MEDDMISRQLRAQTEIMKKKGNLNQLKFVIMCAGWLLACRCFLFDDAKQFYCCFLFVHFPFQPTHSPRLCFHSGQTIIFYFKQKFAGIFTKSFACVCAFVLYLLLSTLQSLSEPNGFLPQNFLLFISIHWGWYMARWKYFRQLI